MPGFFVVQITPDCIAVGGILSLNDWAVIVGILCTVGTFGINWYYKRKEREDRLNGNVTGTTK
ncbi:HP1 family phage holin [Salmonella sp. 741265062_PST]|uniref:HP1 family phage holin n=1 Tax=Salmonella sp. 741265062_PST TaxID=3388987 RepID=UPI00397F193B